MTTNDTVLFERFNTLEALVNTISKREVNEVYAPRKKDLGSNSDDISFCKTASFEASAELMKKGFKEPLDELKTGIAKIAYRASAPKARPSLNVVGYAPHVPNAIQGIPQSMIMRKNIAQKKKTIHLVYGFSAIGSVSSKKLLKGGILFLSLVNQLELDGFSVKVDLVRCTTGSSNHAIGFSVNVKEYGQKLNLLKLCYPLAHPSMLRRTAFRWSETFPQMNKHTPHSSTYCYGYGTSLYVRMDYNRERELDFLKRNGILKEGQFYCNVYQCFDECKTVDELKKLIGLV